MSLLSQSNNYQVGEDASKAVDKDVNTDWTENLSLFPGSQAVATYKFPDNYYVWINQYGFIASRYGRDKPNNNPLELKFEGHTNKWLTMGIPEASSDIVIGSNNQVFEYNHYEDTTLFDQVRVSVLSTYGAESDVSIAEFKFKLCHVFYCKPDGIFPGSKQDDIATAPCDPGWLGDQTRECGVGKNPSWGEHKNDSCKAGPPVDFSYPERSYTLTTYRQIEPMIPRVTSVLNVTYTSQTQLPSGLFISSTTGIITGKPTEKSPARDYTISVKNTNGNFIQTRIAIAVNRAFCPAADGFGITEAGTTAKLECEAGEIGGKTRECKDAEVPTWEPIVNTCVKEGDVKKDVPVAVIVVGTLLSIVGVGVIVLCVWIYYKRRNSQKRGGKFGSMRLGGAGSVNRLQQAAGPTAGGTDRSVRMGNATGSQRSAKSVRL